MMESSMGYLANNNAKWYEWMLLAPSKRVIRYDTSDQIQMGVQRAHGPINYIEPDVVVLNGQRSWFAAEARGFICMHNISKNKIKFACTAILVYRYSCTPKLTIHDLHSAHLDDSRSDKPLKHTLVSSFTRAGVLFRKCIHRISITMSDHSSHLTFSVPE